VSQFKNVDFILLLQMADDLPEPYRLCSCSGK